MEIKVADVAESVDARDLKSPGATEITHLFDLTRAGNRDEAGGDSAVLSNAPPLQRRLSGHQNVGIAVLRRRGRLDIARPRSALFSIA
jgi:hypothetical protein